MSDTIKILDKEFVPSISEAEINFSIEKMAQAINQDLADSNPLFLGILNGAFLFAAELFKRLNFQCQISFLKLASYQGSTTSGNVKRLIGLNEDIKDRTVVILEDIIDTGITMEHIKKQLLGYEPKTIKIATLLFKPQAFIKDFTIDYIGFYIPSEFIIGFGLDYNGYGRNLKSIYKIKE